MTDRGFWVAGLGLGGNVRRLMYQALICAAMLGDEARRLRPPLDAKDLQGLANALIDGVRGNSEFGRDFFGIEVLIDEAEAVELTLIQPRDTLRIGALFCSAGEVVATFRHAVSISPRNFGCQRHLRTPEQ
jgi:hypothetical protein